MWTTHGDPRTGRLPLVKNNQETKDWGSGSREVILVWSLFWKLKACLHVFIKNLNFFSTEERMTWISWMTWVWVNYQQKFFLKWTTPLIYPIPELKGTVHPKMKIVSSFTHHHVVPNLYEFLSSVEHKSRYFEECW